MAANRYFDRDIDARNPRTARRALATGEARRPRRCSGRSPPARPVLLWSAWMLNPLCVKLMPIAVVLLLIYPLCKRFTWGTHFVLGAVDGLAPLGAFIGIAGHVTCSALLLFAAVTLWVAGFDIIYALMDFARRPRTRDQLAAGALRRNERPRAADRAARRDAGAARLSRLARTGTVAVLSPASRRLPSSSSMKTVSSAAARICSSSTSGSLFRIWHFQSSSWSRPSRVSDEAPRVHRRGRRGRCRQAPRGGADRPGPRTDPAAAAVPAAVDVGVNVTLSGPLRKYGAEVVKGVQAAVDEIKIASTRRFRTFREGARSTIATIQAIVASTNASVAASDSERDRHRRESYRGDDAGLACRTTRTSALPSSCRPSPPIR